ncbi:hypothetical protein ALC56_07152, partial [Trachymyrmex septentrionalis]
YFTRAKKSKKSEWCYSNDSQVIKNKRPKGAQGAYMLFFERINHRGFLRGHHAQEGADRVGASGTAEAKGSFSFCSRPWSVYSTTWVHPNEMPGRRFRGMHNVVLRRY